MRVSRSDKRNQVASIERSEHLPGDLVDIWYDPLNKDIPGWRGPAQISPVNTDEGNVIFRSQGKTLDRRDQEVRAHVRYLVFLRSALEHKVVQWNIMRKEVEAFPSMFMIVGVVHSEAVGTSLHIFVSMKAAGLSIHHSHWHRRFHI